MFDGTVSDVAFKAAARLKQVLPSFTDPRHYANHDDIQLVRELESLANGAAILEGEVQRLTRMLNDLAFYPKDGDSMPCTTCGAGL